MKLDRNTVGRNKYALIKRRLHEPMVRVTENPTLPLMSVIPTTAIDFGDTLDSEFFVIRLKDRNAAAALHAYAEAARQDGDLELYHDVSVLAARALNHPNRGRPT